MGLTTTTDSINCNNYQLINATAQLQQENLQYLRGAKSCSKQKVFAGHIIHRLRKKLMQPIHNSRCLKICRKQVMTTAVPMPSNTIITNCYPYQQDYNYPITMNDWPPLHTPLLTMGPVPVILPTPRSIFTTHITPVIGAVVQPVLSTLLPQTVLQEDASNIWNYTNEFNYCSQQIENTERNSNVQAYFIQKVIAQTGTTIFNTDTSDKGIKIPSIQCDPIESYLKLPKELFPSATMLALDPNPLIDEFCKMPNLQQNMPWLLDLEFGIPKSPITRPIPTYNVKFNSIHCKNAPDAIHPGFESCDPNFKKVLLFYYDCIVSSWYRGYMIMQCDRSVENFQSWLLLPMQVLGMCWP